MATSILITLGLLAFYYVGMMAYDLYLDKLSQANNEEDEEQPVDISDQVRSDFQAIPVNKPEDKDETQNRFENLIRAGITAEKASRMMQSIADGNPAKGLENVLYIIHDFQVTNNNLN